MFVLDCSATMACFFEDEATKETQALLDALADEEIAVVPSLWLLEVTNILLVGERRGRNTVEQTKEFWGNASSTSHRDRRILFGTVFKLNF